MEVSCVAIGVSSNARAFTLLLQQDTQPSYPTQALLAGLRRACGIGVIPGGSGSTPTIAVGEESIPWLFLQRSLLLPSAQDLDFGPRVLIVIGVDGNMLIHLYKDGDTRLF